MAMPAEVYQLKMVMVLDFIQHENPDISEPMGGGFGLLIIKIVD